MTSLSVLFDIFASDKHGAMSAVALEMLAETACKLIAREDRQSFNHTTHFKEISMILSHNGDYLRLEFRTSNLHAAVLEHLKRNAFMFAEDEPIDPLVRICFETTGGIVVEGDYDLDKLDVAVQHVATRDGFMIARMTLAEFGKCGAYGLKFLPFNTVAADLHPDAGAVNGPAIYARVVLTSKGIDVVSTQARAVIAPE